MTIKEEKLKQVRNHFSEVKAATLITEQSLYLDVKGTQILASAAISKLKDYLDSAKDKIDQVKDILDEWSG